MPVTTRKRPGIAVPGRDSGRLAAEYVVNSEATPENGRSESDRSRPYSGSTGVRKRLCRCWDKGQFQANNLGAGTVPRSATDSAGPHQIRHAGDERTALPLSGGRFFHQEAENRRGTASAICKRGPPDLCGQAPPLYLISLRVESGGSFSEVDHDILHLGVVLQNGLMGFAADA